MKNKRDGDSKEGESGKTWAEAIEHVQGDLQVPRKVGESARQSQSMATVPTDTDTGVSV